MSNGVDFRKLALDLRAQLTAAQSELAALREELAKSKQRSARLELASASEFESVQLLDNENSVLKQRIADAERRNAEDLRDANRYRYLRDQDNRDGLEPEDVIVVGIAEGEDIVWGKQMDQAIDVMMESAALTKPEEAKS